MTIEADGWAFNVALTHMYRDASRITEQVTGMSQTRLDILHELFHAEELSQADLQQHLGVEGPVITRIVKQMEAEGLVTRRADPNDNRYTLVSMKPEIRAQRYSGGMTNFRDALGARIMAGLDENERANLLRMIELIARNLEEVRETGLDLTGQ